MYRAKNDLLSDVSLNAKLIGGQYKGLFNSNWCTGKTGEECRAGDLFNIFLQNQKEVPDYESIMTNKYYLMAIMQSQIPMVMTDKHGNTHIFGYMDDEMQPHTHFKNLYVSGALFRGVNVSIIENNPNQYWHTDRKTGEHIWERTANDLLRNGSSRNMFLDIMKANEKNGANPLPYFYIVKDKDTYSLWDVAKIIVNAVFAIGSNFFPFLGGVLKSAITSLIALADKFIKNPNYQLGLADYKTIIIDAFAPLTGMDSEYNKLMKKLGNVDSYITSIRDLSVKAFDISNAIGTYHQNPTQSLLNIGKVLGVDGNSTLKYLKNDLQLGNIIDISQAIKKPIIEVEKIMNQMTNAEIVNTLVRQFDAFAINSTVNGALSQLPAQQFILDLQAGVKGGIEQFAGAIPNSPGVIGAISQSVDMNVNEFWSMLSIPLNLPIFSTSVFDRLTIESMVERAKSYALSNIPFVLPSNLSEDLQKHLVNYIPRVVTNADVRTVSVKPDFYIEFL